MAKKKKASADPSEIINKKARFLYIVESTFEAGLMLKGTEVKSLRNKRVHFTDSFARVQGGELFLYNLHISPYEKGNLYNHEPERVRKLLVHKREIFKLASQIQEKRRTLIPLKIYLKSGKFKTLMGVCIGKKMADKRETIKKRDMERDERFR